MNNNELQEADVLRALLIVAGEWEDNASITIEDFSEQLAAVVQLVGGEINYSEFLQVVQFDEKKQKWLN